MPLVMWHAHLQWCNSMFSPNNTCFQKLEWVETLRCLLDTSITSFFFWGWEAERLTPPSSSIDTLMHRWCLATEEWWGNSHHHLSSLTLNGRQWQSRWLSSVYLLCLTANIGALWLALLSLAFLGTQPINLMVYHVMLHLSIYDMLLLLLLLLLKRKDIYYLTSGRQKESYASKLPN